MSQRFEREIEIFNAALELPANERASFLTEACRGDIELLRRLEGLLGSEAQAGAFLENPAPVPTHVQGKTALPSVPEAKAGDRIDRYKLLQQIGEGGCGVVFMAEQEEPVRRRVALKVIKLGMDTKNVIARFEAERQALAMMDHPHIARVFDAGATESGRPFFVMELVRGVKITDYCDENNLSTRQRLELFMQVCRAVQHAHQKGIIHRDLKPSNILVTSNDGEPMPKVIDFGIAKAAQGRLTDRTLVTAFEQFLGTPAYMSPEQAELSALDVDTRSDIYSLGVLLYELLTGQTPFDARLLRTAGLDEIRRTIREKEPVRPSTRLNSMPQAALTIIARRRQLAAPKLIHSMKGDLDWIVMKALEKNRARRYETANGFAADIQRYLNNEPVMARPPGKFYSFQKMVRRHKIAFAVGGLAIFSLVVCLGIAIGALVLINGAKKETTEELRNTYLADARATRVSGQPGRKFASLAIVKKAAAIRAGPDVRDEAIACLAMSDLEVAKQIVIKGFVRNEAAKVDLALEHFAFGYTNGSIVVRSTSNNNVLATLSAPGLTLEGVGGFSPGGKYLSARYWSEAEGESDGVWDWTNQTALIRVAQETNATNRWSFHLANDFSGDDRYFCASRPDGSVSIYELPSGREVKKLPGTNLFYEVYADPGGKRVACTSRDNPWVEICNVDSSRTPLSLACPAGVTAAAWSFDGKRLAAAALDFKIYIWDASSGRQVAVLPGHASFITSLAFNHAGNLLASASYDDILRLWNPESDREVARYQGGGWNLQFSADDTQLMGWQDISRFGSLRVGGSRNCRLLDIPHQSSYLSLPAFSADGRILAAAIDDEVCFWEAATGRKFGSFPLKGSDAIVFPPDGKSLITVDRVAGVRQRSLEFSEDEASTVLRVGKPRPIYSGRLLQDASLSRDGRHLAVTKQSRNEAIVLDLNHPPAGITLSGHPLVDRVALSPDGLWAATGSWNNPHVKIWDARTGDVVRSFSESARTFVNFSPDGRWLATSSSEYKLWEVGSWQPKGIPQSARDDGVGSFTAFSPDGRVMARNDAEKIQLSEPSSGRHLATLEAPGATRILKCQFSPDGTFLAVMQIDRQVQLWDLRQLREELAPMHLDWDQPAFPPASNITFTPYSLEMTETNSVSQSP